MRTHAFADLLRHSREADGVAFMRREQGQRRVDYRDARITQLVFGLVFFGFLVASDVTDIACASIAYAYQSVGNSFGTVNLQTAAFTSIGSGGAVDAI